MKNFKFELGEKVKDQITGYSGIIIGRIEYITGCDQYLIVNQKVKSDGERKKGEWFDENRLIKMKGQKFVLKTEKKDYKNNGGPSLGSESAPKK